MDVKIEKISKEDDEVVMEFLKQTFFKVRIILRMQPDFVPQFPNGFKFQDEPLNASLELGDCKPLEHFCRKTFNSGLSFKATDTVTGELLGVILCRRVRNGEQPDPEEEKLYRTHEKFYRIMEISEYAYDRVDLFGRYPNCKEIIQGEVLSVRASRRNRKVGTDLFNASVEEASAVGINAFYCQCSSDFAARAAISLNFTEVFSIAYSHFNKDGVQTLNPKPPHDNLKVFIKWLGPVPK